MRPGSGGGETEPEGFETLLLSDLHLGAGRGPGAPAGVPDDFDADQAFASFADSLCARAADEPAARLVILGDLLDLLRLAQYEPRRAAGPVAAALGRMDRIAAAHPAVFAALGRLAAAGHRLEIVPGNHDLDLVRPVAQQRLRDLICGADRDLRARVRFHPWILHLPGVLYAEHGSQFHDINRLPTLLTPWSQGPDGPLDAPLGAHFGGPAGGAGPLGAARRSVGMTRGLASDTRLRTIKGRPGAAGAYRDRVLAPYADRVALPRDAVQAIDRLSSASTARMMRRVLGKVATGRGGYDLRAPARGIHDLLAARGASVSYYVLAHSHAADRVPLAEGAEYLNTGTWSIPRPKPGLPWSGERLTYVSISRPAPEARLVASLERWDAGTRRSQTLA